MSAAGGAAAAAAAAARRRAEQQEEEQMTGYTASDLAEGWEFKILRSATGAFKKPEVLRAVLEEEGRAGWVMVEKFDSHRVRLKRSKAAKAGDVGVGFDPYRTSVGMSENKMALIIIVCVFTAIAIMIGVIAVLTRR
ncbi:MAG: hypothetical protein ACOYN0_08425 [Phycisphaerales bacterium]